MRPGRPGFRYGVEGRIAHDGPRNGSEAVFGKNGQPAFDAIGFNLGQFEHAVSQGIPADICYAIEENHWNGKVTLQLNVKDMKI
jgi:hypothetical protein